MAWRVLAAPETSFGSGVAVPFVRFPVPGPLALLVAGIAVVGAGGLLDGIWHTSSGLDETSWSLPHAMLGRGILLTALGFAACRLALGRLHWYSVLLLAWLVLEVSFDLVGGPILRNPPPSGLQAIWGNHGEAGLAMASVAVLAISTALFLAVAMQVFRRSALQ